MDQIQIAINLMLAAQRRADAAQAAQAAKSEKSEKSAKSEKSEKSAKPVKVKAEPPSMPLTVTREAAEAFRAACLRAGRRGNLFDRNLVVADEAEAIRAMTGGVYYAPHGACLDSARRLATTAINRDTGAIVTAERRTAPTVAGYVAGVPDQLRKIEADRVARQLREERLAFLLPKQQNEEQVALLLRAEAKI
jgi:hypothetical protein